jgi:glyoxylase I family protein
MQLRVEHIGLPARDPAALADWYVRTLGAAPVDLGAAGPPFFVALPGGTVLEIYTAAASGPQTGENGLAGFRHLALRVDSIAAAQAELAAKGVAFPDPVKPAAGGGQVLFFRDLEGNLLHFVERPAGFALGPR